MKCWPKKNQSVNAEGENVSRNESFFTGLGLNPLISEKKILGELKTANLCHKSSTEKMSNVLLERFLSMLICFVRFMCWTMFRVASWRRWGGVQLMTELLAKKKKKQTGTFPTTSLSQQQWMTASMNRHKHIFMGVFFFSAITSNIYWNFNKGSGIKLGYNTFRCGTQHQYAWVHHSNIHCRAPTSVWKFHILSSTNKKGDNSYSRWTLNPTVPAWLNLRACRAALIRKCLYTVVTKAFAIPLCKGIRCILNLCPSIWNKTQNNAMVDSVCVTWFPAASPKRHLCGLCPS